MEWRGMKGMKKRMRMKRMKRMKRMRKTLSNEANASMSALWFARQRVLSAEYECRLQKLSTMTTMLLLLMMST
jgi:hypothetical protein